jgi:hypothetical protein
MIEILKPVYMGNNPQNRKIGIAEYRLRNEPMIVEIHIKHQRSPKHGTGYIYPQKFFMSKLDISKYPLESIKTKHGEIPMYIVPIIDLKPVDNFKRNTELEDAKPPKFIERQEEMF